LITIPPLNRANVRRMIGALAARNPLSKHIVDTISERTEGVPLFVEEVTRLLLERSEQSDVDPADPSAIAVGTAR
jgi:predicted ATPase